MVNLYDKASPELIETIRKHMEAVNNTCGYSRLKPVKITKSSINKRIAIYVKSYITGKVRGLDLFECSFIEKNSAELNRLFHIRFDMLEMERKKHDLQRDLDMLGEDGIDWWVVKEALKPYGYPVKSHSTNMVKVQRWATSEKTRYYSRSSMTLAKMDIRCNAMKTQYSATDVKALRDKLEDMFTKDPSLAEI